MAVTLSPIGEVVLAVDHAVHPQSAPSADERRAGERDRSRTLLEVNNAIVSQLNLPELLRAISSCLRREVPHDLAGLTLYDPDTQQLLAHALDFPRNQDFVEVGVPIPLDGTPEGLAFTSRQTVLRRGLSLTEFPAEIMKRAEAEGLKSGCAVPLISHGRVLGTLSVVSLQEAAFTEDDAELLGQIGKQVAIAVANALAVRELEALKNKLAEENETLEDRVRVRTKELEQVNRELRETQAQLVQSSKMASLGMLAAGIAHEINTPIGVIHSNVDVERRAIGIIRDILRSPAFAEKLSG